MLVSLWDILNFARNFFERNWRSAPPPLADACHAKEKFSLHFLICAPPIFSSPPAPRLRRAGKRKRKLFCWILLWMSRAAGLRFGSGEAEFPPRPPSASPSLWTPTEFVPALAGTPLKIFQIILNSFAIFVLFFTLKIYLNKVNFTTLAMKSVNNPYSAFWTSPL